jgi:DMSO/TMAO reductase YedYZ molybdopterin-dependent catalytic subunit
VAWLLSIGVEVLNSAPQQLLLVAWLGALSMGWGYAVAYTFDKLVTSPAMRPSVVEETSRSRRQFLIQFGGTALAVTFGAWGLGALLGRRSASVAAGQPIGTPSAAATPAATAETTSGVSAKAFVAAPGTRAEVTANKDFYRVDTNVAGPPSIDEKTWALKVDGLVDKPLSLSYTDVRKMPPTEQDATLECISNEVGGDLISSTHWTGLKLRDVLNQAGLKQGVVEIKFTCADEYTESLSVESAMDERTLLVYATNGEALAEEHGFPMRLYVPNRYGMKNPKWLVHVEAIGTPHDGYWEVRGWDKQAIVKSTSVIDTISADHAQDGVVPVGGIAFGGARGISKVEVSVDGGSWQETALKEPISPLTWRLWRLDWKGAKGHHELRVRATDGQEGAQIEAQAPLHPSGASGYHSQSVDIA